MIYIHEYGKNQNNYVERSNQLLEYQNFCSIAHYFKILTKLF